MGAESVEAALLLLVGLHLGGAHWSKRQRMKRDDDVAFAAKVGQPNRRAGMAEELEIRRDGADGKQEWILSANLDALPSVSGRAAQGVGAFVSNIRC